VTGYGLHILPQHARLLEASAIDPEVARERGYVSVDSKKQLERYGFAKYQLRIPGLLVPVHDVTGSIGIYQYRPDSPRQTKAGKTVKYETPARSHLVLDVPPRIRGQLGDPKVPLWITEGARKADAAVSAGLCCIGLLGVTGWRGTNGHGGRTALPDWAEIALNGQRRIYLCFDSDVMIKATVHDALEALGRFSSSRGALIRYIYLPHDGDAKTGLDDYIAAGGAVDDLVTAASPVLLPAAVPAVPAAGTAGNASATSATSATKITWDGDLAALLDDVVTFLHRFVAYPNEHAGIAHALWTAHAHQMDAWESTPRIAFLSPEPGSGKTRALEVTELLVPRPVEAVNTTPAYLFRKVSDPDGLPTILYDEIDTLFGPRAKDNEEIRGMLNAGHRRGAVAGRCVTRGELVVTEELPAYCAVALAGLGGLPDTLLSRAVVIGMKRRKPGETIEPFRRRVHQDQGHALRDRLAAWATAQKLGTEWPEMPEGIQDRDADVWEALLCIADAAGGDWPKRAREAAVALVADTKAAPPSLGVRLLADLRAVWDGTDGMHTEAILARLNALDEAPWGDLKGKPLDPRRLSTFLNGYKIGPKDVRAMVDGEEKVRKGYRREDLHDAWQRYLPAEKQHAPERYEGDSRDVPASAVALVADVADANSGPPPSTSQGICTVCGEPLDPALLQAGFTDHGEDPAA
jgi:Protein of unknown function (DUF3631)/Domain of unknown function (DUF3854)